MEPRSQNGVRTPTSTVRPYIDQRCISEPAAPLLAHVTVAHPSLDNDPGVDVKPSRMLITAGTGYGKSSLLEAQCPADGVVMSAAAVVSDGLPGSVSWLGLDDFHRVGVDDQDHLIELLGARPEVGFAIASQTPFSAAIRRCPPGRLSERDATDLALPPYAIARLLADEYEVTDPEAALRVAALTSGWPALVHFCGDVLSRDAHADLEEALTASGTSGAEWIRVNVLDKLSQAAYEVLAAVAAIDATSPLSQGVCEAVLGEIGRGQVPNLMRELVQVGVLVPRRRVGRTAEVVIVAAVALALRAGTGGPPARNVVAAVARAYATERAWLPAARAYAVAGDRGEAIRLIGDRGQDMLRRGDARAFISLVDTVAGQGLADQPDLLRRTYADALRMVGDPSRARRAFAPLVTRAGSAGWEPGLATGVASLHYLCGEFETALETLERYVAGPDDKQPDSVDLVDWLACRAHVLVMIGRPDAARLVAERCHEIAERLGNAHSLGVAHLALARTSRGAVMDLHYERAVHFATEADDAVTATRALQAQTSVLLAAARYHQAGFSAGEAARMARLSCPPGLQSAALHNLGEALARTGRFEEALWHLECSVALCRRLGPARAALGLVGIAGIHRLLGHTERARAAYSEATELARGSGDVQVMVSALCGNALLTADESPAAAEAMVEEALCLATDDLRAHALTAAGRIALIQGDRSAAADHARRAVLIAREERAADLLAEGLELEAAVTADAIRARGDLREALSIWTAGGARPDAARIEVLIGRLPEADGMERSRARDAARDLRRLGLRVPNHRLEVGRAFSGTISVAVLGPFTVTVEGFDVPLPAWRSRQARTLVKILAAHRGRVVTRDRLCDFLWPDDDPARTGHRLSVLLATVRGVLDPAKSWPPDRYLVADSSGVRLDLGAVVIDAEMLLRDAAHAAELLERGQVDCAREVLAHVDALHRGEAFEDESEEWADGLREEVRAAWGRSMRRLANLQLREGRGPEALGLFARLLSIDPYDEQVHRRLVTSLVRAGRHGEARRTFERWCQAMREIDAPLPEPSILHPADAKFRPRPVLTPR
jgi:DNA-binding SARP family transcriptional activator